MVTTATITTTTATKMVDDHGDDLCHNTETHENYDATEEECATAGHMWMGDDDRKVACVTTTHANYDQPRKSARLQTMFGWVMKTITYLRYTDRVVHLYPSQMTWFATT